MSMENILTLKDLLDLNRVRAKEEVMVARDSNQGIGELRMIGNFEGFVIFRVYLLAPV